MNNQSNGDVDDVVWAQRRYDGGWYGCTVARRGERHVLTVTLLGVIDYVLHREPVKFDKQDPDKWRTMCEKVINNPDLRSLAS